MKKITLTALVAISSLSISSCTDDDLKTQTQSEPSKNKLELSKHKIELTKEKKTIKITITTDDKDWSAIGSASWINVTREGNLLIIDVDKNETINDRVGKVLVVSKGESSTIDISQRSSLVILTPNNFVVSDIEGEEKIAITLNTEKNDYRVTKTDAGWLNLTLSQDGQTITFYHQKNYDSKERVGTINIEIAGKVKTIQVKQLGALVNLLPYPTKFEEATRERIMEFEEDRMSKFNTKLDNTKDLSYYTRSTHLFSILDYKFSEDGKLEKVIATGKQLGMDNALKNKEKEFIKFLIENGFKQREDNKSTFDNNDINVRAKLIYIDIFGTITGRVEYTSIVEQPTIPTFNKFPELYTKWGVKKEKIDAYEAKIGGTFSKEDSSINGPRKTYDVLSYEDQNKASEGKRIIRVYNIEHDDQPKKGLLSSGFIIQDKSLAFWEDNNDIFLTKEFKELAKKEGFKFVGIKNKFFQFQNTAKDLEMLIGLDFYSSMPEKVINIGVYKIEK